MNGPRRAGPPSGRRTGARRDGGGPAARIHPLTPEHLDAFAALFGPKGACGGCWCMTPRLSRRDYDAQKGEGNRRAMETLVRSGRVPGLLLFDGALPIGWVSVEPRERFPMLATSRVLAPVDATPVWSITCLFVARTHRGRGVSVRLVDAAAAYAASEGAAVIEGYPVVPKTTPMPAVFAYPGLLSAYLAAGFVEVARRSATRPIVRKRLGLRTPTPEGPARPARR